MTQEKLYEHTQKLIKILTDMQGGCVKGKCKKCLFTIELFKRLLEEDVL